MSILINVLIAIHVLVCFLMVGVVLMQRPKNEGLGAAFGGGMTENIFGAQTTHVLQKFTVWLGIFFFVITLVLAMLYARRTAGETAIQRELLSQPAVPASSSAPAEPVVVTTEAVSVSEVANDATSPVVEETVIVEDVAVTPAAPAAGTADEAAPAPQ
jgi:preprotein translocase subunit SecG